MKIDRLIGILSVLLQKKVTVLEPESIREKHFRITSELAEKI